MHIYSSELREGISYFHLIEYDDLCHSCCAVTSISVPSWKRACPWLEGKYLCRNTGESDPTIILTAGFSADWSVFLVYRNSSSG